MAEGTNSDAAYDVLLKILLIGDSESRKSELLYKYLGVAGEDRSSTTLGESSTGESSTGLDYMLKDTQCNGKKIKLQLWDTAGQERFRSVTSSYYRGSHGCLLVFSLKKQSTFVGVNFWLEEIKNNAPSNFQTVLVATDIEEEDIAVNLDIAREFAREHQLPLLEVNLTTGGKTDDAFSAIVEKIMQVYGKYRPSMVDSLHLGSDSYNTERRIPCSC